VKKLFYAALAASALCAGGASAKIYHLDVTVSSVQGDKFSAPIFAFTNLSSPGVKVSTVEIAGGAPWDFVYDGPAPYDISNPAGGTRTLLIGEESATDPNDGTTFSIKYGLTSFDPGDVFHYSTDPEAPNGASWVVDIRPFLTGDIISATAAFAGGPTLLGHDWTLEYIDPNGDHSADGNQRYRLSLEQTVRDSSGAVPEPAAWALMIVGFGGVGGMLRRRRIRSAAA
jgi:hypothetical protein